jgi:hypothetical protein
VFIVGGAGWLALLWAAEETDPPRSGAANDVYTVQKAFTWLFQHPVSFSRRLARLPKGTSVAIVERRSRGSPLTWARGTVDLSEGSKTGWLLVAARKQGAGEVSNHLGGTASATNLALVIKGVLDALREYNSGFAGHFPQADRSYQALRDAWLAPAVVSSFVRAGGLRMPEREAE